MKNSIYGSGENPPYSLYQAQDGKWGLRDGTGEQLPAIFDRLNEHTFSCVPWEIVTFDEKEGFELQVWYDPDEVWFNFTFGNPDYPEEFTRYLWNKWKNPLNDYKDLLLSHIPTNYLWFAEALIKNEMLIENEEFDKHDQWLRQLITAQPEIMNFALTTSIIETIMRNKEINPDFLCALWYGKVSLDYDVRDTWVDYMYHRSIGELNGWFEEDDDLQYHDYQDQDYQGYQGF